MTLSDLTSKTPEELNVMCAEALGWKIPDHCFTKRRRAGEPLNNLKGACPDFGMSPDGEWHNSLPNYTGSYDAIMPEVRKLSPDQFIDYLVHLSDAADASHIGQFQAHYHPELVTIALILTLHP